MQLASTHFAARLHRLMEARRASKGIRAVIVAFAVGFVPDLAPVDAFAAPLVEFDVAPAAECRDVTPPQRIRQYPNQRLIEVTLPVSVRFRDLTADEVDELAIEVTAASPGMRVDDFAPATQLASDIERAIETTTTTKKNRSFDGSLGGTLPVPGAEAVARVTPTLSVELSNCDTATEKINRLPPKHAIVVSGTSSAGRGVFFKLRRYSQTSLEGVHELKVTFVAPRAWKWSQIRVDCTARGEQKVLWMRQSGTIGRATRTVQLVEMTAKPLRQHVLKPIEAAQTPPIETSPSVNPTATTVGRWRPARDEPATVGSATEPSGRQPDINPKRKATFDDSHIAATPD